MTYGFENSSVLYYITYIFIPDIFRYYGRINFNYP